MYLSPQIMLKKIMTYADGYPSAGLGQAHKCGCVKPINEIKPPLYKCGCVKPINEIKPPLFINVAVLNLLMRSNLPSL